MGTRITLEVVIGIGIGGGGCGCGGVDAVFGDVVGDVVAAPPA
jgi:hypothetical protein